MIARSAHLIGIGDIEELGDGGGKEVPVRNAVNSEDPGRNVDDKMLT